METVGKESRAWRMGGSESLTCEIIGSLRKRVVRRRDRGF